MLSHRDVARRRLNGFGSLLIVAAVVIGGPAWARPDYLTDFGNTYPAANGSRIDACGLCHGTIPQLNPYGAAFRDAGLAFMPIEAHDSDGDGVSNLDEINALTFPGDPADVPALPTETPTPTGTPVPSTPTPTATGSPGPCVGDCNANGVVTVDELLRAVNIALGIASADICLSVDGNGNGAVSISELLVAVNAALSGCP